MRRKMERVHFVGIGGVGMSALAELLKEEGGQISGSDLRGGPTLERLAALGIAVQVGHRADVFEASDPVDAVVYSSAIAPDNAELVEARRRGIPIVQRGEMLAEVMRQHEGIAIAGTHGKTTTTALVTHLLSETQRDPTALVGGRFLGGEGAASGVRHGKGRHFVAEADESDGSFLLLTPITSVITNIDPDHLEHYGDFEALENAFVDFVGRLPFWGTAIVCLDHPGIQRALPRFSRRCVTYGLEPGADLQARNVEAVGLGMRCEVFHHDVPLGSLHIPVPGRHNVANSLAALCVGLELEIPFEAAARALASFRGIARRFEIKGEAAGVTAVDDYAHHPAEVRATLAAARDAHPGRIIAVFQPHRFSRTRDCFDDFTTAFGDCDALVVCETYAAGEAPIAGAEARDLAAAIEATGHDDAGFTPRLDDVLAELCQRVRPGDLVVTLGAGDVGSLAPRLLEALRAAGSGDST